MENGTVWSNSSESSDDSSSPALAHHAQRLTASNMLQTTLTSQLSFTPHKSSASTPSLSSNQEEDEAEVFSQADPVPNGHLRTACTHGGDAGTDCAAADRVSVQSVDLSDASAELSGSCPDVSCAPPGPLMAVQEDAAEDSPPQTEAEDGDAKAREGLQGEASRTKEEKQLEDASTVSCCTQNSKDQEQHLNPTFVPSVGSFSHFR